MDARIWLPAAVRRRGRWRCSGERTVVGRDRRRPTSSSRTRRSPGTTWRSSGRGGVLMATDLDSRNGTALNGEPLDRPRRLRDGDTLIVGGHRLEVSTGRRRRAGATVPQRGPLGRPERGGAGDRGGAGRSLPQRGRLRRPSRHPGRDRRGAARQRAHRPAPPRRPRRQARRRAATPAASARA